jgi:hypothetical protein
MAAMRWPPTDRCLIRYTNCLENPGTFPEAMPDLRPIRIVIAMKHTFAVIVTLVARGT